MVIRSTRLNRVFRALADPTRRRMLEQLATQDRTVNEMGEQFTISQPAVTKHLQVLERAGLIGRRKEGRLHYSRARQEAVRGAAEWMRRYTRLWNDRLDELEDLLSDPKVRKELSRGKD